MRIYNRASGFAVALAVLVASGCASGGSGAAKPGDKTAAAKPGDKPAPAKPGDKPAPAKGAAAAPAAKTPAKPADPKAPAKPTDPKAAPKPTEAAKAPAKPADPKTAPKPTEAAKTPPKPVDPKAPAKTGAAAPAATGAAATKPPAKPGETAKTPAKPTDAKTTAKPTDPKAAPKPTEPKPPAGSPAGAAGASGFEGFIENLGRKFQDMKVLGMGFKPYLHEEIGYTDNVFYQDDDEVIVVDLLGFRPGPPAGDTIDNNLVPANPGPMDPIGKVDDIFNRLEVGFDLEMAVNSNLVPILEEGQNSIKVFHANLDWIEYLTEDESPDAVNYNFRLDLLSEILRSLFNMTARGTTWYARLEADYSQITDPLDVPLLQYSGTNPTLSFAGNRVDFTRNEWWVKPSFGVRGPRWDAMASYKIYDFSVDDDSLDSADHQEHEFHGEIGFRSKGSEHRFYGFVTTTFYDFPARGVSEDAPGLRNFDVWKVGPGWEGPLFSRKLKGSIEAYYLAMDVHQSHPPTRLNIDGTGDAFNQSDGYGTRTHWTYRPYITKSTAFDLDYERDIDWSVVSDYKVVDTGYVSLSHPINDKLTTLIKYSVTHENVAEREKRLYQELGLGFRYKLMNYTHLTFQYAYRTMASSNEPVTAFSDSAGEIFLVQANGDFAANIVSLGINFDF